MGYRKWSDYEYRMVRGTVGYKGYNLIDGGIVIDRAKPNVISTRITNTTMITENLNLATVSTTGLTVTITMNLQSFYTLTVISEKTSLLQLFANIAGLLGIFSVFGILFREMESRVLGGPKAKRNTHNEKIKQETDETISIDAKNSHDNDSLFTWIRQRSTNSRSAPLSTVVPPVTDYHPVLNNNNGDTYTVNHQRFVSPPQQWNPLIQPSTTEPPIESHIAPSYKSSLSIANHSTVGVNGVPGYSTRVTRIEFEPLETVNITTSLPVGGTSQKFLSSTTPGPMTNVQNNSNNIIINPLMKNAVKDSTGSFTLSGNVGVKNVPGDPSDTVHLSTPGSGSGNKLSTSITENKVSFLPHQPKEISKLTVPPTIDSVVANEPVSIPSLSSVYLDKDTKHSPDSRMVQAEDNNSSESEMIDNIVTDNNDTAVVWLQHEDEEGDIWYTRADGTGESVWEVPEGAKTIPFVEWYNGAQNM